VAERRSRAADRALRPGMRSPGRAPVSGREDQQRFWRKIAEGLSSEDAAIACGVSAPVGTRWFREYGGMPPISLAPPSGRYLSFAEREEIALLKAHGTGVREMARKLGRSPSTVSRELRRNAATRGGRAGGLPARRRPSAGAGLPAAAVPQAGRPARLPQDLTRPRSTRAGRDRPPLGVGPGQLPGLGSPAGRAGDPAGRASALPALRHRPRRPCRPPHRRRLRPLRLSRGTLPRRRLRQHHAAGPQPLPGAGAAVQCDLALVDRVAGRDR
jgi:Helix-turn-helix domain